MKANGENIYTETRSRGGALWLTRSPPLPLVVEHDNRVGNDATNGDEDADNGLVADGPTRHNPP